MKFKNGTIFSFFTSGFPSHVRGKAIDVGYYCNDEFVSPLNGIILSIEKFNVGRPNRFSLTNYDFLILAKTGNTLVKILHVEPYFEKGEEFKVGDVLGKTISSPYTGGDFSHAHIEGLRFSFPKVTKREERAIGKVTALNENYVDVTLLTFAEAGGWRGLGCCGGLLNGSLPYAGYGGIIGVELSKGVSLMGREYHVHGRRRNLTVFEKERGLIRDWEYGPAFKVMKNEPIDGFPLLESVLSYHDRPIVRLFGRFSLKEGEEVDVWSLIRDSLERKV
ncbi:MAG: hypothetical protein QXR57_08310 [Metallosphaera sp.]|uniref:DUF8155 domain-containing protein n=1 Tax=Metallosphaera cuprina (strain Ar-4) TaxID=1006006 RepID=F4G1G6_METCR|nr:hypothetical protein [Metallosphaera cuprina]AEB94779.1 conserved hypothetical protein [Metallosphaera cuprina Ar-4]